MPSEYTISVANHRRVVTSFISLVIVALTERAIDHDMSKLEPEELADFERMTPILSTCAYGSVEYKQALEELGAALEHHYAANRHHPEHFPNGVADMNLIDLIEMVCDWMAAMRRMQDGAVAQTMLINQTRFGLSDQLASIISNTMTLLDEKHGSMP